MKTLREGCRGAKVEHLQQRLKEHGYSIAVDKAFGARTKAVLSQFQAEHGLKSDGVCGKKTWAVLMADPAATTPPQLGEEVPWSTFVPLLGPASKAEYSLSEAQMPQFPPGVTFLSSKYQGEKRTNCTMLTAYLLGCGFGRAFSLDDWRRWQLAGGKNYSYKGYGPGVCADWGVAQMMPSGALPKDGVYLLQTLKGWPRGHSWLILDYDEATGRILTLESNTKGTGLNGLGFYGLGPLRSTNAHDWRSRTKTTWTKRTKSTTEISMARLAIDHQSVRDWIASQ